MNKPNFTSTNESITIIWEGKSHVVKKGSPQFENLRKVLREERWADVPKYLTVTGSIESWANDKFKYDGNTFKFNGEELPPDINGKILEMATNGEDPRPLFRFWERLQKNPSFRSVKQLYGFMKHENIPLTADGHILLYKSVDSDYMDHHSRSFNNRPGKILEMPRNQISDDPQVACHEGFHVGALGYVRSFGNGNRKIIVCKVDPQNVVCVPYDHSRQKMRVCKYEVLGNYGTELPSTTFMEDTPEPEPADLEPVVPDDEENLIEVEEQEEEEETSDDKEKKGKKKKEKPTKRKPKRGFIRFEKMGMADLMKRSIDELRKYATYGLDIVGASKIPGGKTSLVSKILKIRDDRE